MSLERILEIVTSIYKAKIEEHRQKYQGHSGKGHRQPPFRMSTALNKETPDTEDSRERYGVPCGETLASMMLLSGIDPAKAIITVGYGPQGNIVIALNT